MYLNPAMGRSLNNRRTPTPVGNTSGQVVGISSYSPTPETVARYSSTGRPKNPHNTPGPTDQNQSALPTRDQPGMGSPYNGVKNPHAPQQNGGKDKDKHHKVDPNSIQGWLGTDEQYQKDRADLVKNFLNMKLENKENRGNLRLDKQTTMGRLSQQQADAEKAMSDDFAARGLFGGASYQGKLGDFNKDYTNQRTDAVTSFQRNIEQLLRDLNNARTLKDQNLQQARLEAIRRRAATLGITG